MNKRYIIYLFFIILFSSFVFSGDNEEDMCPDSCNGCLVVKQTGECVCEPKNTYYIDKDGDKRGSPTTSIKRCSQPNGYVTNNRDCDDNDATVYPNAPELCDGKDNQCPVEDGSTYTQTIDEGCDCGNGIVQRPNNDDVYEECDDGPQNVDARLIDVEFCDYGLHSCTLACSKECTNITGIPQYCGDFSIQERYGEECDDGNSDNTDACLNNCELADCGDTYTWLDHEQCDDGNSDNTDSCLNNCELADCGDTYTWLGHEECDDGNSDNTDSCLNTCKTQTCGDGFIWQVHEMCDPPTLTSSNIYACDYGLLSCTYCNSNCAQPTVTGRWCGDFVLQKEFGEQCEINSDCETNYVCNNCLCQYNPGCGNNIIDIEHDETCDLGKNNGLRCTVSYNTNCSYCNSACNEIKLNGNYCGDGILQPEYEKCDDGNFALNDGCSNCVVENKYYLDLDGDGYGSKSNYSFASSLQKGYVNNFLDCNDLNKNMYPTNTEICDNLDNNCNNITDDILDSNFPNCADINSEIKNTGVCENLLAKCDSSLKKFVCEFPEKYVVKETSNYCDMIDNDCDSEIDENCECLPKEEKVCGSAIGECKKGIMFCQKNGDWGECKLPYLPIPELCDNLDNDCDGKIDEDIIRGCFVDSCSGFSKCSNGVFEVCVAECSETENIDISLSSNEVSGIGKSINLSKDDIENAIKSSGEINQKIEYKYETGSTLLKNKISTNNSIKDMEYTLFIPKCLANHIDEIEFENKEYTIIEDDPIIAWHFADSGKDINIDYKIKGRISEQCLAQVKGLPIANLIDLTEKTNIFKKFVLPLILIALAIGSLSILQKPAPVQEKPKTEQDYINDFIEKKRKKYVEQVKNMNFSSSQQAETYLSEMGLSEGDKELILKQIKF